MIRVGEAAWLLELAGRAQVLAAHRALLARDDAAVRELVPGASSLLVVVQPDAPLDDGALLAIEEAARAVAEAPPPTDPARVHQIPVRYDGEDLAELAQRAGMSAGDFAARHAGTEYQVAFVGFQPGFAYLGGLPRELHALRRASPRARVAPGSVAIGGEWTGVYPLASPGGWHLLGRTDVVLFDAAAESPALLQPGDVVRFVPR